MPFTNENAKELGRKGGMRTSERRPKRDPKTLRNQYLRLNISTIEKELINGRAAQLGMTKIEYIIGLVKRDVDDADEEDIEPLEEELKKIQRLQESWNSMMRTSSDIKEEC